MNYITLFFVLLSLAVTVIAGTSPVRSPSIKRQPSLGRSNSFSNPIIPFKKVDQELLDEIKNVYNDAVDVASKMNSIYLKFKSIHLIYSKRPFADENDKKMDDFNAEVDKLKESAKKCSNGLKTLISRLTLTNPVILSDLKVLFTSAKKDVDGLMNEILLYRKTASKLKVRITVKLLDDVESDIKILNLIIKKKTFIRDIKSAGRMVNNLVNPNTKSNDKTKSTTSAESSL